MLSRLHNPITPSKEKELSIRKSGQTDVSFTQRETRLTSLFGQVIELVSPALAYFAFLAHDGMK